MTGDIVIGVFLERNGGAVMQALPSRVERDTSSYQKMEAVRFHQIDWNPTDVSAAAEGIQYLAKMAADMGKDRLKSVAIAAPGPFLSLRRSNLDGNFGQISGAAHLPLRGFNLFQLFHDGLIQNGGNPEAFITIQTDAEACAIGEAMLRQLTNKDTLAFILVTEGVGLGVVQGRTPLSSALHSEFGMLHVRWDRTDPLRPTEETDRLYSKSLSEMAENSALRKRCGIPPTASKADLVSALNDATLDLRAYYLAQACLTCTVILAPHQIVIGADVDTNDASKSVAERTNRYFRNFLSARNIDGQPTLQFAELEKDDYVSASRALYSVSKEPSFRITGALGMCHSAARADRGAQLLLRESIN